MRTRADGFSLVEALAALTLTGLLATALVSTAIAQLRLARAIAQRAASVDAVRTTSWVLAGEARRAGLADVHGWGADSLAIRAFRGRGVVCSVAGSRIIVRYSGDRLPDPAKDSVASAGDGTERTAALLDVAPAASACAAQSGERLLRLDLDRPLAGAPVVLVFETGSYHISGRAFRFRSGAEGRQPITAEVFRAASRFTTVDERGVRYTLHPDSAPGVTRAAAFPVRPR